VPESDWPAAEAQRAVILGDFDANTEFGDRRQARPRGGRALGALCGDPRSFTRNRMDETDASANSERGGKRARASRCDHMPEGLKWRGACGPRKIKNRASCGRRAAAQEIVFIGAGMDEAAISKQLDAALLTDEELRKYVANWASSPDPPHALPAAGGAGA